MQLTLKEYQRIAIEYIYQNPRCALFLPMGLGKTATVLWALDTLRLCGPFKTLIIAPLRVAKYVWSDEVKKWDRFAGTRIVPIVGSLAERKAALNTPAHIHTINYENLPWLVEAVGDKWPWKCVVADEITRLKSFRLRQGSKRAKALSKVAFSKVYRFIGLTGTPAPNGLRDLWGQLWFIDGGKALGKTYSAFERRWFKPEYPSPYAPIVPLPHAQREIEEAIRPITISIRAEDYFDLKKPVIVDVPVHLPDDLRAKYKELEREMFTTLATGHEIDATSAAAKSIKCLQFANGALYTESNQSWVDIHNAKLEALESIIEETGGEPLLVAYHFRSDLARLKAFFPHGRELDKREETIREWNAGHVPLLFAHPASAGHGLNLADGGHRVVFFGLWWSLEERMQLIERVGPTRQAQAGHNRVVYIYQIRAVDTVDDVVIERIASKRRVQDLLMEAAKKGKV